MEKDTTSMLALFVLCCGLILRGNCSPVQTALSDSELAHYFGKSDASDYELVSINKNQTDDTEQYNFKAFGRDLSMILNPVDGFFSSPKHQCHYEGKLVDGSEASIAISTCNGLSGYISVDGDDYFLAKLTNAHAIKVVGVEDPHIIFKGSPSGASCTVQSDSSFSERKSVAKRKRRAIGLDNVPVFVELNVYLDETMYAFYGNKADDKILSVLNQVRQLFKDKSIGNKIKLTVQQVTVFEESQNGLHATDDADTYLRDFCRWQQSPHEGNPDVSLLVTRLDLQSNGYTGVTGQAAAIEGACDPARRCVISEDHGPAGLVFTIAHEIAHALGIHHDGELSSCKDRENIMASSSPRGKNAYKWSSCSMDDFSLFLHSDASSCLYNKPPDKPLYNPTEWVLPGCKHNATQQCQDTFPGTNAVVATRVQNTKNVCMHLLCDNEQGTDMPSGVPALAGTQCARYGVCLKGFCLQIRNTRQCTGDSCPAAMWNTSPWQTCENCMQIRLVACIRVQVDLTITVVTDLTQCPADVPISTQTCNCDLAACNDACGSQTMTYMYSIGTYVDCTSGCGTSTQSRLVVCVNEQSNTVPDSYCQAAELTTPVSTQDCLNYDNCQYQSGSFGGCSVSCGAGTMTRTVSCVNGALPDVVDSNNCVTAGLSLPPTTQPCYLADCEITYIFVVTPYICSVTCGTGIQTRNASCVIQSTSLLVDPQLCLDRGLMTPVTTSVCTLENCPVPVYYFVPGIFGECSSSCGGGVQSRNVDCVLINTNDVVAFENCINAGLTPPPATAACNTDDCPSYTYFTGEWMACSATCGSGEETRTVSCISISTTAYMVVPDAFCVVAEVLRPDTVRVCETGVVCPTRYVYTVGIYGMCSATCGAGMEVRPVQCVDTINNYVVADSFCTGTPPDSTRDCNLGMCPEGVYQFIVYPWTICDCDGLQTRPVQCVQFIDGTFLTAIDNDCFNAGTVRPPTTQSCTPPITCLNPVWSYNNFTDCPVTCGIGQQIRSVFCLDRPGGTVVGDQNCDATSKPPTSQECDTGFSCPPMYIYVGTAWSSCSATCGEGVEIRSITCYEFTVNFMPVADEFCESLNLQRPPSSRPCSGLPPCAAVWVATPWTPCSATCGVGMQERSINCYRTKAANDLLNVAECTDQPPPLTRGCYLTSCPLLPGCGETIEAFVGNSYVFSSPGYPVNYPNDYICDTLLTTTEGRIELTFSEFNVEECFDCNCDYLRITDIGTGEETFYCGVPEVPFTVTSTAGGFLTNFITDASVNRRGYTATFQVIPAGGIQFGTGPFGPCSVSCGEGVRSRSVTCYNDGVEVNDAVCSGIQRPPATEPCVLEDCRPSDFCGNDTVRTVSGERIMPPNFPEPYQANLECINIIKAPINNIIYFNLIFFDIEDSENCNKDSVTFSEEGVDDVVLCGAQSGTTFSSTENEVNITFVTDGDDTGHIGYIIEYTFIQLEVDQCADVLLEPGQVFSPNHPGNYDNNEDCVTTIFSASNCVEIVFNQIEIEDSEDCSKDFLQITDLQNDFLTKKVCGSQNGLIFKSFSQTVSLTFVSDGDVTNVGYIGDLEFVDCAQFVYYVGQFSDCTASCGGGVRTRTVECINAQNQIQNDLLCGEAPPSMVECAQEECPSCDVLLTDTGEGPYDIRSPNYPDDYNNNDNCTYTIVSPNGECIVITYASFDLEGPDDNGECTNDFVEVIDIGFPTISQVDCGSVRTEVLFRSLSSQVQQRFVTNDNLTASGFVAFVTFLPCPQYAYLPGEFSDCSVSCGEGERIRTVVCWSLAESVPVSESSCDGERPPTTEVCFSDPCPSCDATITIEDFWRNRAEGENTYDRNQDCIYTVVAPGDMCVTLIVFTYSFEEATDGVCVSDYFTLTDTSDLNLNQTFCGSGSFVTFPTASNTAIVTFHSDNENEYDGFLILNDFHDCPDFIYRPTSYGDCDRTCGNGMQTRTIYCVMVSTGNTVADSNCEGTQEPPLTQSCNLGDCPECDELIMNDGVLQMTLYEPNLNCRAEIVVPEGQCVKLTKIVFELPDPVGDECTDSIEIFDTGNDAPGIEVCGEAFNGFTSRSNTVDVRFVSNNDSESGRYTLFVTTVDCPTYGFVPGEYSDCTRSCGGGTQTRTVECQELANEMMVEDSMCSDAKPEESQDCNEFDCPPCGDVVDTSNMVFSDPAGSDADYENLQDCTYSISATEGKCPAIFFTMFELQEPDSYGNCLDYVQFDQPGYENTFYQFCGIQTSLFFTTSRQEVTLTFYSDESIVAEGFRALNIFESCPDFAYAVGDFGPCSVTCGEGFQVRQLLCIDLRDNSEVEMSACEDLMHLPVQVNETCELEECPGCESTQIINVTTSNLEFRFEDFDECETNLTATFGRCLIVFINTVDLPANCEENYIEYYDANAPWLSGRLCSDSSSVTFTSQTSTVILKGVSDDSASASDGLTYLAHPTNCPMNGFVVSEESCSVTCGEGILTRYYECQNLKTGAVLEDSDCAGDVPSSTANCELDDCPSCDMNITSTRIIQVSNYANNEDCTYTINLGSCFTVLSISFDLEPADKYGQCLDYVSVYDLSEPRLNRTFCGNEMVQWTSVSNQGIIKFISNENVTREGFNLIITPVGSCAQYIYNIGEFSMCPCGSGESVQTRVVTCVQISDGSEVSDNMCSDAAPENTRPCQAEPCDDCFEEYEVVSTALTDISISPEEYLNNIDCLYNFTTVEGFCMTFVILELNLEDSEDCENDFIQVLSEGIDRKLCGTVILGSGTFQTRSNEAQMIFRTNNNVTSEGLRVIISLSACPEYGFVAGVFDDCSLTCGGGIRTRTVQCQKLQPPNEGDVQMNEEMCTDEKPEESETCNEDTCPVCLMVVNENEVINTAQFDNDTSCFYRTMVSPGQCVGIFINTLNLADPDDEGNCTTDYFEIRDLNNTEFSFIYCGDINTFTIETSSSNYVEVLIHVEDGNGKRANFGFVERPCGTYEQSVSEFGECSQTCGGGGERTREVDCVDTSTNNNVVEDFYCNNLEQIDEMESCGDDPCPACDDTVTAESGVLVADDQCSYILITSPDCALLTIDEFDIPDGTPGNCEDSLSLDGGLGVYNLCAENLTNVQFVSKIAVTTITFNSDGDDDIGSGFSLRFERQPCPEFEFFVGEYGNCSVECEGGVMTRIVECRNDDGDVVEDNNCAGIKPKTEEECNTTPCTQAFYEYVTSEFQDCFITTGLCVRTRDVTCQNNVTAMAVDDSFCTGQKPLVGEQCDPCPVMNTMTPSTMMPATDATTDTPLMTTVVAMTTADSSECGGAFGETPLQGSFVSPNYPNNYPPDITCVWNFTVPSGMRVSYTFQQFDVQTPGFGVTCTDSNSDYTVITDSAGGFSTICSIGIPFAFTSAAANSDFSQFTFRSNSAVEGNGFVVEYMYINEA